MFVDYGDRYLKPKWKNPPSRYRKPLKKRSIWDRKKPKKYMRPRKDPYKTPRTRTPNRVPPQFKPSPGVGDALKAAKLVTKYARPLLRLHPYTRIASYLWDAYDFYDNWRSNQWAVQRPSGYNMSGWTMCCDNGVRPLSAFRSGTRRPSNADFAIALGNPCAPQVMIPASCGQTLQVPTGLPPATVTFPVFATNNVFWVMYGPATFSGDRMNYSQLWAMARPNPDTSPMALPYTQAAAQPLPDFDFPPYPQEFVREGSVPEPLEWPELSPVHPIPPYEVPAMEFEPGKPPKIVPHQNLRDRAGRKPEKSKKPMIFKKSGGAPAGKVFGAATEAMDAVNDMWKTIPEEYRTKNATQRDKFADVWKHLDKVDWEDAAVNWALSQASDYAIAKFNQKVNSPFVDKGPAAKYWPFPSGPTAGSKKFFQHVRVQR